MFRRSRQFAKNKIIPARVAEESDGGTGIVSVHNERTSLVRFFIVMVQVGLVVLVIRQFQVESSAFLRIAVITFIGFVVHSFLPLRYRLPFFLLLSLTGIGVVFGIPNGAWMLGIGLVLISICHLPLPFGARVLLLVLAGVSLAVLRAEWFPTPWSKAIWPILGAMFMFRLIVYLYDLRNEKAPVSVWRTLSYFFLLPNVCFPLFPVVDYKTFRRNYYDGDAYRIYQVGVDWMVRGLIQLILYRFVYHYLTQSPAEVTNFADLVQYLVCNFLLYLRVSGQFHVIVGMLHLFGFHLPETHHRYVLSSSFTDFWRRINIYWKDFMLKVFYYPIYFKLRTWGTTTALVVSTLCVFVVTWILHSYQWFWLRGSFLLSWQDVSFWGILALLVLANALYETKHGRKRSLGKQSWKSREFAKLAFRTVGTFSVICVLWSLWTCESLSAWISLWGAVVEKPVVEARLLLTLFVAAVVVVGAVQAAGPQGGALKPEPQQAAVYRSTAVTIVSLVLLALMGIPAVYSKLGPTAASVIYSLRSTNLSRLDNAALERGYYEDLLQVDRFNSELWKVYMNKPLDWLDVQGTGLERYTGDFQQKELIPSFQSVTRYGTFRTNRWGMRDKDYERQPSTSTYRIALLGASAVMGWGVEDDQTFETVLEDRLNRENLGTVYAKYEILNFGIPGYRPLQQLGALDKAVSFSPRAVFYVATSREASQAALHLIEIIRKKIDVRYDYLREIAGKAGIDSDTTENVAMRRLEPYRIEVISWLYRRIVRDCRERGIVPVWIFMPMIREDAWREDNADLLRLAGEAGFIVLDLINAFKDEDISSLRLAEWDTHPNAKAHRMLAAKLHDALLENKDKILGSRVASDAGKP